MGLENPLSKFSIDYWYHALMVIGATVFLLSGTGALKEFPVIIASSISAGIFFFGLGEWINHPLQTSLKAPDAHFPGGVITSYRRNAVLIGYFFDLLGLGLIFFGLYKLIPAIGT